MTGIGLQIPYQIQENIFLKYYADGSMSQTNSKVPNATPILHPQHCCKQLKCYHI